MVAVQSCCRRKIRLTWEQRKLSDYLDVSSEKNTADTYDKGDVLSVSGDYGIVNQIEFQGRSFAGVSVSNYGVVRTGDIVYTKSPLNANPYGIIKTNKGKTGIVSTLYAVYRPKENTFADFVQTYFEQHARMNNYMHPLVNKGAKNDMKVSSENALKGFVLFPKYEEQKAISNYFAVIDNLITLHQREQIIRLFSEKKKSNLNFTTTWEQRKLGELVISHNAGIYISKEDYGTGTNVIGVGNIYDNDIFDGEIYRLGPVNDEKFLLEENDLIYGESSLVPEGIARTVCVGKNGVGSAFAWHTRRVKLDQSVINSHFATLELNYNIDVRKYLISVSTQTALTGMTTEGYFGVTLSLPTVEEQAYISSLFKQLDNLITLHQRKVLGIKNSYLTKIGSCLYLNNIQLSFLCQD
ncbi:MAG: restriction endonuclease subunit S [Negativicutes bacterium]|nr:restriction endonuclease subunit S [Negativicutes bacterium]